jgi:Holliday junction resolvase RusA-like endonuclease
MTTAAFFVPGKPRGKGRPRFTRTSVAYTDDNTREYEDTIRSAFRRNARDFYADKGEAVTLSIVIRMPVPKSWSKKRKEAACSGELAPLVKPDIDNVCKAVMDALNGAAWHDDTQVVRMDVHKNYVEPSLCGVAVVLRKLNDDKRSARDEWSE